MSARFSRLTACAVLLAAASTTGCMSLDEFQRSDDAIKDALKYAYKFRKKDKSGEMYAKNKRQIVFGADARRAVLLRRVFDDQFVDRLNDAVP